jgi:hypothetical protein
MKTKTLVGVKSSLSPDKLFNSLQQLALEAPWRDGFTPTVASTLHQPQLLLGHFAALPPAVVLRSFEVIPGAQYPKTKRLENSFDLPVFSPAPKYSGRKSVDQEEKTDSFHDSESEDIYDLYNACNGIIRDGLLDVVQLNEFSPAEAQALNVRRLREIWEHTRSGCPECENIIKALNTVRQIIKEDAENDAPDNEPPVDVNHIDSIS